MNTPLANPTERVKCLNATCIAEAEGRHYSWWPAELCSLCGKYAGLHHCINHAPRCAEYRSYVA